MYLNISDIQHFSLGDGDGIRTTVFFKGCNLKCPWCHNPETWNGEKQILRYGNGIIKECGQKMSIDEVLEEIMTDKDFYIESGGGITFSGGEVMLQYKGAALLGGKIKQEGVNLTVDTAGNVPYSYFEVMNEYADEYLYDYKIPFEDKFYSVTGGDLKLVSDNIRNLIRDGKKVRIRIPLIPGFNTDSLSLEAFCRNLCEIGCNSVDLLPFHRLGSAKYEALGMKYDLASTQPLKKDEINDIKNVFNKYFNVRIEK